MMIGQDIYNLIEKLFPITRSITGSGVRETLQIISSYIPKLKIYEVPTGTQVFDWTVPKEWVIREAYIEDSSGKRIIDMKKNNLHIMGYSTPVNKYVGKDELLKNIYTLPEQPDWIPYVTSYYKERYGFCMTENQKKNLQDDKYHIIIDSELIYGNLTYAELIIPGDTNEEIFLSTYICHPSMANNELSGPCLTTYLAQWLSERSNKYTYRIVFIPETIGALTYLSRNLKVMQERVIAGFNITCVGDDRDFSYIPSRYGNTLADKVAKNVLKMNYPDYIEYSFLDRGSDERQYCAPGVDLPVCSICRTKYGMYPEYHTSADDLSLISPQGLDKSYDIFKQCIEALEGNAYYCINSLGEPQLGRRGLYPTISQKGSAEKVKSMMDLIAYADGTNDLIDISNIIGVPISQLLPLVNKLVDSGLFK